MQPPARYLVLIESDGAMLARLFDAARMQRAEFDGASEEVAVMTEGLTPQRGVATPEWAAVLSGHSDAERAAALLYTLDV
jgi:hypothetical protein